MHVRQTDYPHFMVDIWDVHDLWLTYGTYMSNSRHTECSHFMVERTGHVRTMEDGQNTKFDKHRQELPKCDWS